MNEMGQRVTDCILKPVINRNPANGYFRLFDPGYRNPPHQPRLHRISMSRKICPVAWPVDGRCTAVRARPNEGRRHRGLPGLSGKPRRIRVVGGYSMSGDYVYSLHHLTKTFWVHQGLEDVELVHGRLFDLHRPSGCGQSATDGRVDDDVQKPSLEERIIYIVLLGRFHGSSAHPPSIHHNTFSTHILARLAR